MKRIDLKKVSVARSNTIRGINRQIVLNYVREKGPISRAEIARETNLQRSTVSLIVNELVELGLIKEVEGESSGGRPPILLSLHTTHAIAIGVDLGTVRTTVATCDLTGRIIEQEEFWTDPDAEKTTSLIVQCVQRIISRNGGTIEGIGISLPAIVDVNMGHILYSPHFKWRNPEIIERIKKETGLIVRADNDANAAALAELWFGRPEIQDVRDFILVFIENGVGTGIVFDGQIYHGKCGVAGEFGHMTIGSDAPVVCAAGRRDCWESFASERAALARYAKHLGKQEHADRINFTQLVELAFNDDKKALAALKETAHYIGIGIANLIQGLSPEAVIVGGTVVKAWSLIDDDVRAAAGANICLGLPSTNIIASTLGSQPTLMGAFSLILADKFASVPLS